MKQNFLFNLASLRPGNARNTALLPRARGSRSWKILPLILIMTAGALTAVQGQVVVHRPGSVTVVRRPVTRVYYPPVGRVFVAPRPIVVAPRPVVVAPRPVVVAPARILVVPPVFRTGVVIATLPACYTVTCVGNVSYYYANGVYYVKSSQPQHGREIYESVMPPVGTVVQSLPEGARSIQVDGKNYFEYHHVVYKVTNTDGAVNYEVTGYTSTDNK